MQSFSSKKRRKGRQASVIGGSSAKHGLLDCELAQLKKKKLEGEAKKRDRKIKKWEIELNTASK